MQEEPVLGDARVSSRPVKPGDTVELLSVGVRASVISVNPDRTLTLQAGVMRVTAKEDEVYLLEDQPAAEKRTESSTAHLRELSVSPELDLRGLETLEAMPVLERYIDAAVMAKLHTVTVIHGKGTGALRAAVQQDLKKNRQVKSFRLGHYGEGETGVTVVELK